MLRLAAVSALCAVASAAEVVDCIAATVGKSVIARSAVQEQARITAYLNRQPLDLSEANLHRTAERLVDVTLLRREMELSHFAPAGAAAVEKLLAKLRDHPLEAYGIDDAALRRYLAVQTQTLRFVELRFRSGSSVTDPEIESYYRETYVPEFLRTSPGKAPPELEDARDRIETMLVERRVDQAMEQWLKEARAQIRVTYFPDTCAVGRAILPAAAFQAALPGSEDRLLTRAAPFRSGPQ